MKYLLTILVIAICIFSCDSSKFVVTGKNDQKSSDTLRIANDSLDYEILILEPGFDSWLVTQPPKGYHSIEYLESKNYLYVLEYNNRVYDPRYPQNLYPQSIDYDPNVHYGIDVNYLLFNYFKYFEQKYRQKL